MAIVSLLTSVLNSGVEARVLRRPRHCAHICGPPASARNDGDRESSLDHENAPRRYTQRTIQPPQERRRCYCQWQPPSAGLPSSNRHVATSRLRDWYGTAGAAFVGGRCCGFRATCRPSVQILRKDLRTHGTCVSYRRPLVRCELANRACTHAVSHGHPGRRANRRSRPPRPRPRRRR